MLRRLKAIDLNIGQLATSGRSDLADQHLPHLPKICQLTHPQHLTPDENWLDHCLALPAELVLYALAQGPNVRQADKLSLLFVDELLASKFACLNHFVTKRLEKRAHRGGIVHVKQVFKLSQGQSVFDLSCAEHLLKS